MANGVKDPKKIGLILWETEVTIGRTDYYFQAMTKRGSYRKANNFYLDNYNGES